MIITRELATKVRDVVAAGLTSGLGRNEPGQMCVEAAVCYGLGLPHGDHPGCVNLDLRSLKIRLNDVAWPSNEARAQGLRRLAIAQLGSLGTIDTKAFLTRVVEMTIRTMVPIALRAAVRRNPKHAEQLEAAAVRCEQEGTSESARNAQSVAHSANAANAAANAKTKILSQFAESVVQILIDLKAPGCEFLDLVPALND